MNKMYVEDFLSFICTLTYTITLTLSFGQRKLKYL